MPNKIHGWRGFTPNVFNVGTPGEMMLKEPVVDCYSTRHNNMVVVAMLMFFLIVAWYVDRFTG